MNMKISIAVSILILAVGVIIGRHDRQELAALRSTHESLNAKALKLGISSNPAQSTRRSRQALSGITKLTLREVIELAKEVGRLHTIEGINLKAIAALNWRMMENLTAWDVSELKDLLVEIQSTSDLNELPRSLLVSSCISVLANDHPQAALGVYTNRPELFTESEKINCVCTALASWSRSDLNAALEWLQKNPQEYSDNIKQGIITAVAEQNPQHAFQLIGQLGLKYKDQTAWHIVNSAKTLEQKSATLAGLREYLPKTESGKSLDYHAEFYLNMLARDMHLEGVEATTRWISESKLTPQELKSFLGGLGISTEGDESGRWVEWMRQSLPPKQVDEHVEKIIHQWAKNDYRAAAQWADSQPEGKDREQVFKKILSYWPAKDPTGKDAFKQEYGIK
jgi:hypothetical protein